jgi:hypothetical protein
MAFRSRSSRCDSGTKVQCPLPLPERCRGYRKGKGIAPGGPPGRRMGSALEIGFSEALENLPRWEPGSRRAGMHMHAGVIAVSFPPAIPRRVASQQSPRPLRQMKRWNQGRSAPSSLASVPLPLPACCRENRKGSPDGTPRSSELVRATTIDQAVALRRFAHASDRGQEGDALVDGGAAGAA